MAAGAVVVVGMGAVNTLATSNQMAEENKAEQDRMTQMDEQFASNFGIRDGMSDYPMKPSRTAGEPHAEAERTFLRAAAQAGYRVYADYDYDNGNYDWSGAIETAENSSQCAPGDIRVSAEGYNQYAGSAQIETCVTPGNTVYRTSFKEKNISNGFNVSANKKADTGTAVKQDNTNSCQQAKAKLRAEGYKVTTPCL